MIADALQFMGAEISYFARSAKPDAEAAGMTFKPLPQLLADSEVVFTCLNKNVLLLGENEFAQLGAGKVLFNTSIGPGFDSAALEKWLDLPDTHFFCDTRAAAGPVAEDFFARENVRCANVSAGRTKLYQNISASEEERQIFKELMAKGVKVEIQIIPAQKQTDMKKILK